MHDDFLGTLGGSGLAARLRRLQERLSAGTAQSYSAMGQRFEPGWYGLFRLLAGQGAANIGQAASALGVSHVTIIHAAKGLIAAGLVEEAVDEEDRRRRRLSLSPAGEAAMDYLGPVWARIDAAADELLVEAQADLIEAIDRLETALARESYAARIARQPFAAEPARRGTR